MTPPAIILLNGTSSSGKSTLGRALQRRIDPQPVLTGLDSFVFGLLPPAWHGDPHGVYFSRRSDGAVPVHLGPGGEAMARAFHRAVAAMADCGLGVIVDDVLFEPWLLDDWLEVAGAREVFFVGVQCALEEAERREIARGDRQPGQVRSQIDTVHQHGDYDLVVDTTQDDPRNCAQPILAAIEARRGPSAFERLRAGRSG